MMILCTHPHLRILVKEYESEVEKNFFSHFNLFRIHAFFGQTESAISNLENLSEFGFVYGWLNFIHEDPMIDNLRNDPEFVEIMNKLEAESIEIRKMVNEMRYNGEIML